MDRLFDDDLGEPLHKRGLDSWRQRRRLEIVLDGVAKTLFIKRFENPPRWAIRQAQSAGVGARSLAGVEWGWMNRLFDAGIPCPVPVALGEEFDGRRELRSVVVSEAVSGRSLEKWVNDWHEIEHLKQRILQLTASLVRRFHARGWVHRDLYLSHLFFDPANKDDSALALIDLQRVFQPSWNKTRWIVKDLAALQFSVPDSMITRVDRLRWLLAYLSKPMLDAPARRLAYLILGKSARMARRAAQKHRATIAPHG